MKQFFTTGMVLLLLMQVSCEKESLNALEPPATRSGSCLATEGLASAIGIASYPDAHEWTTETLSAVGKYYLALSPAVNDIAVFMPYYHTNGTDAATGHVARVKKIVAGQEGNTITFWGTNQPTNADTWQSECGCDNFSDWTFFVSKADIASGKIKFFHPEKAVLKCGALFAGNAANDYAIITLTGEMKFGNVPINSTVSKTLTISNSGSLALTINAVNVPNGYKIMTSLAGVVLQSGQSVSVPIDFKPTMTQAYNGTLSVQSNAAWGVPNIELTGNGIAAINTPTTISPSLNLYSAGTTFVCTSYGTFHGIVLRSRITNINSTTGAITFELSKQDNTPFDFSGRVGVAISNACATDVEIRQFFEGEKVAYLLYTPQASERKGTMTYYVDALQTTGAYVGRRYSCGSFTLTY